MKELKFTLLALSKCLYLTSLWTLTSSQSNSCRCDRPNRTLIGANKTDVLSPNYPTFYPANCNCAWRVVTPKSGFGMRVELTGFEGSPGDVLDMFHAYDPTPGAYEIPLQSCTGNGSMCRTRATYGSVVSIKLKSGPSSKGGKFNVTITSVPVAPYVPEPLMMYGMIGLAVMVGFLILVFIVPFVIRRNFKGKRKVADTQVNPTAVKHSASGKERPIGSLKPEGDGVTEGPPKF